MTPINPRVVRSLACLDLRISSIFRALRPAATLVRVIERSTEAVGGGGGGGGDDMKRRTRVVPYM
jgi:hypothetical protein